MSHQSVLSHVKRKPVSMIGAPISAQECQQLKQGFAEKFPDQVPSVFISREIILNSIAGVSNISGILFAFGLDHADVSSSRSIIMVPCRNRANGESGMIPSMDNSGYLSDNGERIDFEKLMMLLGNHVANFSRVRAEIPLSKLPRGYFWGINKIVQLLQVENCAGLIFHFGYNPAMRAACRQFQCVLEVVDANHNSLNMFLEYGQCNPPCIGEPGGDAEISSSDCVASVAAEKFSNDAEVKLNSLRGFRDNWLLQQENGHALYERYYFLSPAIVAEIQDRPNQEAIWQEVYYNGFSKCLELIDQARNEEAKTYYVNLMQNLVQQYLMQ
jgi:hypothetical protein